MIQHTPDHRIVSDIDFPPAPVPSPFDYWLVKSGNEARFCHERPRYRENYRLSDLAWSKLHYLQEAQQG